MTRSKVTRKPTPRDDSGAGRGTAAGRDTAPLLIANIDGGARGNPGASGFGVFVQDESGEEVASLYGYLGEQTNNVAEYAGLLAALRYASSQGARRMKIRSDSELLVRQINGEYRVKNPRLIELHRAARGLISRIGGVTVEHVRREQNKDADRLANEAMDTRGESPEGITDGLLP